MLAHIYTAGPHHSFSYLHIRARRKGSDCFLCHGISKEAEMGAGKIQSRHGWLNVNDSWLPATAQSMTLVMDLDLRGGGLSAAALVSRVVREPRLKTYTKSIFFACGLTNR